MYENTTRELGDKHYQISDWPIRKTLKWQRRLVGKLGKSIPHLINDKKGSNPTGEELERAISSLLDTLDEDTFITWIEEIIKGTHLNNQEVRLDNFKGGDSFNLYKLVYEILKWNFRDFFAGLQGVKDKLKNFLPAQ